MARMADETKAQATTENPEPASPQAGGPPAAAADGKAPAKEKPKSAPTRPALVSGPLLMAGIAVGALVLGGLTGSLLIGPRLVPKGGASSAAPPAAESAAAPAKGKGEGKAERPIVYKVENIIVNPAGSEGTRFLMASVAFELPDDKVEARLRDHDYMVRDAIIAVLERQSLDALTRPGSRDSLRLRLAQAVSPLAGVRTRLNVFLPQFVIQ
jgi:flagellar FliL protein